MADKIGERGVFWAMALLLVVATWGCGGGDQAAQQQQQQQQQLTITTSSLPNGQVSVAYSATLSATGGTPPYSWSLASGSLPAGISLDGTAGQLAGTPAQYGSFSLTAQVRDSTSSQQQTKTVALSLQIALPAASGPTAAGGLLGLPAAQSLGANLAAGAGPWTLATCYSVDPTGGRSGGSALLFTAGSGCGTYAALDISRGSSTTRSFTLQAWIKASSDSNGQLKLALHDPASNSYTLAATSVTPAPGADWQLVKLPDIDLLPVHDTDTTFELRAVGSGTAGKIWIDSPQLIEQLPLPLTVFLVYPNYRGYMWATPTPQVIKLQTEVSVPSLTGMTVKATVRPETGTGTTSVSQPAQASQQLTIDITALGLGTYLVDTALLDSGGNTVATWPAYRVTKVPDSFKTGLVNYIDTDNFVVRKGQKRFLWGIYDRFSTNRCGAVGGISCFSVDTTGYLNIPGFGKPDGTLLGTIASYQDTDSIAEMNIIPFAGVDPRPGTDRLTPWLQALNTMGVGHMQILAGWVQGNPNRPNWAATYTDQQIWTLATNVMKNQPGSVGYYTFDEPTTDTLAIRFAQFDALRGQDSGGLVWGTQVNARSVSRWRDISDVVSDDPYPIGSLVTADDFPFGASVAPPMMRTSIWTRETVRQSYGSRPVWMVLQLFNLNNQFPTYQQMKQQAYKAIINGANGIMWWGFVSVQGIENYWYVQSNHQPYFDFRQLSGEVMALEPYLIMPSQNGLASVPNSCATSALGSPCIEFMVKEDPNYLVIFASNFSDQPLGSVTFTLASSVTPPPTTTTVEVYSESRTVALTSKTFSDTFLANDVHVYRVAMK